MGKRRQSSADLNFFPNLYDHDKYFVIKGMWLIKKTTRIIYGVIKVKFM